MRKHPIEFRQREIASITKCWQASQSCNIVGVGSIGKSNLLHHLAEAEVLAHYLPDHYQTRFRAINIDPNMLGPLTSEASQEHRVWAGYELMMHRLFLSFYPFEILSLEEARQFYAAYQALQDGTNPLYGYMSVRYFELGLQFFLRRGMQIVFMFDEFDALMRQMPSAFFQSLRGLRDQNKDKLSYTAFSRQPIDRLVREVGFSPEQLEPFKELFTDNMIYVGPYAEVDALAMADDFCRRAELVLPSSLVSWILAASGKFAGLLRALLSAVVQNPSYYAVGNLGNFLERSILASGVRSECEMLFHSLSEGEQRILLAVARNLPYLVDSESQQNVSLLFQKSLLCFDCTRQHLEFVPLVLGWHLRLMTIRK